MSDSINTDFFTKDAINFAEFDPYQARDKIFAYIKDYKKLIKNLEKQTQYTWQNTLVPMSILNCKIEEEFAPLRHLNSVLSGKKYRINYEEANAAISEFYTLLGQNEKIYSAYKSILADDNLSALQKTALKLDIRDFELSGVGLNAKSKKQFAKLNERLQELENKFNNNLLDSTQAYILEVANQQDIQSLPQHMQDAGKKLAENKNLLGWAFGLDFPTYFGFMTYCDSSQLREKMYKAYTTRASDLAENPEFDNSPIMFEILRLRDEQAQLLGFANYAEVSTQTKMAKNPQIVMDFLEDLAEKSLPKARAEFAELEDFAKKNYAVEKLNPWDISYFSEKLKKQTFAIDEEELREYLPLEQVKQGFFYLVEKLFGVEIHKAEANTWHPDVEFYEIKDKGELIAEVYADLFAREGKRSGAWMDELRNLIKFDAQNTQTPRAFLTANFTAPAQGKQALLTPNEVTTFMHEFGHTLQHCLTKIDISQLSGIRGIPWDAVEMPSQFMENFFYDAQVLQKMTKHVETDASLPQQMLDNLLKAKNFQAGMHMVRQLEFALFDFKLHMQKLTKLEQIEQTLAEVRDFVSVIPSVQYNRFANSFGHIFAGGYAAGYYSYKWAELLSADAFSAFEEEGILNSATGERFKTCFLETGGSEDVNILFERFRGRAANSTALLRHNGII